MIEIKGYKIDKLLFEQGPVAVYTGRSEKGQTPVLIKALNAEFPTPKDITRIKQEYEITKALDVPGALHALSLEKYRISPVLILEGFSGEMLKTFLSKRKLKLTEFLQVAIELAEIVGQVHKNKIIHKDINPENILINPQTLEVRLTGFGISTQLSRETRQITHAGLMEGALAYMSPEQTGRMNRAVDYRTDLYSLGITFYEMLIGAVPFRSEDAMELVHCHIAKRITPPHTHNPEIPQAVSDIVMKLVAKISEERYRSAYGLKADLEECLSQIKTKGEINLTIAEKDISDTFDIPQKLYGREKEVKVLLDTFERVSAGGRELMLVAGYSGIGKSALIYETHKPIIRQRGYFIWGKYDQFTRSNPYHALIQAFGELVRQILTESEERIQDWRRHLSETLGPNAQVVIDMIPEVEHIIGKQPPVQGLPPTESQNRFNIVFRDFVRVFAQKEHPLAIFLDDLQWADSASLKLIDLIITDPDTKYLFMIGAYRDNEVSASHPLMITLEEIRKTSVPMSTITLPPLEHDHLLALTAETMNCRQEAVKALTNLVFRKTGGNPFFVNEFLKTLYQEKLVEFDWQEKRWLWDLKEIEEKGITDNVVELMTRKIQRLPGHAQEVLKLAACIGNRFDLETLAVVNVKSPEKTAYELWEAVREGLIIPLGESASYMQAAVHDPAADIALKELDVTCKFLHDRVQQASYALLSDRGKKETHLKIGRLLLDVTGEAELEAEIFDIVNQMNAGIELIDDPGEKIRLAELNLKAGRQAKISTAYGPALGYLRTGIGLVGPGGWESHYELTLALHMECAESAYLSIQFDEAEKLFDVILSHARTKFEKADVYNIKMALYQNFAKSDEAIAVGRKGLRLFGVKISNSKPAILTEIIKIKINMANRKIEGLIDLPDMTDPEQKAVIKLLINIAPAAYFADQDLMVFLMIRMANICLRHGNTNTTSYAFAAYAMILCAVLGEYKDAFRFGELALKLNEKYDNKQLNAKLLFIFPTFIRHWTHHIKEGLPIVHRGYHDGVEYGDLLYGGYCLLTIAVQTFIKGDHLDEVFEQCGKYIDFSNQTKQYASYLFLVTVQRAILNLKGLTEGQKSFAGGDFNEEEHLAGIKRTPFKILPHLYNFFKMTCLYHFGHYQEAAERGPFSDRVIDEECFDTVIIAEFYFFYSLVLTAILSTDGVKDKGKYRKIIRRNQKKMKRWVDNCPENNLHRYLLVEAELSRLQGQNDKAGKLYMQSIDAAKENEFMKDEALGNELAARFYLGQGLNDKAREHMVKARYLYDQWGATGKVRYLEEKYPQFLPRERSSAPGRTAAGAAGAPKDVNRLDADAMTQALQAIDGEPVLGTILEKIMRIAIKNAGGQRGFLILARDGQLVIEAESLAGGDMVKVLQSQPVESYEKICAGIVHYVMRTRQNIVLNDAAKEGRFTEDAYIVKYRSKSIICVPIMFKGDLAGMLYLENNLTTGAFTPERLEILQKLASQAAMAINRPDSD